MTEAYPLAWPAHWPRRPIHERARASFGTRRRRDGQSWASRKELSISQALDRLHNELERLGAGGLVVSSNVPVRLDGYPRSAASAPDDPAVAVYFTLAGKPHCMPCDRWDRVADNIAAVGKHIEAMRGMERWGVGTIEAAFSGFKALPAPAARTMHWTEVFIISHSATLKQVNQAYRELVKLAADDDELVELNLAVEQARKDVS